MVKAAKAFVMGNRKVEAGEEFDIPAGEEAEFIANGLIEGGAVSGEAPAMAPAAPSEAPGGEEDTATRKRR